MRLSAVLLLCCGCYSFTVAGRAHTVEHGKLELFAAPGVTATAVTGADPNIRPALEVGARYGAGERVDLGIRVGDWGGSTNVRVQLWRSESVELLIAPGVAYTVVDKLALELPLVFGINFTGGHQLVLAPRFVEQSLFGVGGVRHPPQFLFLGGSVGFVWQLFERLAVMPELGVLANVYSEPGFTSFAAAGPVLQGSIALLWDR